MEFGGNCSVASGVMSSFEKEEQLMMTDESLHGVLIPLQESGASSSVNLAAADPNSAYCLSEDASLTDFLFDDDINLNEPLPLISSFDAAGDDRGSAPILQDCWQAPPPAANSSSTVAVSATAAQPALPVPSSTTSTAAAAEPCFSSCAATADESLTPVPNGPSKHDVLLGRGGRNNQWSGNEMLRTMAKVMADRYALAHKRDKPGLAWVLVTQMRQLDPPTRFLKQLASSGEWFKVSDEVAKEKASQCLRDIVAAQKTGMDRKRAFASAPELVAAKSQRTMKDLSESLGGQQNATFDTTQMGPAASSFLGANNPFFAMMGSTAARSLGARPALPPKAISCVSLGASHRTASSLTPSLSTSRNRTTHHDPLLRQLQLLRSQQQPQQQQQTSMFRNAGVANSQFPSLFQSQLQQQQQQQQQRQQPAIISQASIMQQQYHQHSQPNLNFGGGGGGTANATWDLPTPVRAAAAVTEPMPFATTSGKANTNGTNNNDTDEDAALRRWIDRLAEEDF